MNMSIEKESRELFMSLPTWNARDALRMLLEIHPEANQEADDFDSAEIECEARALIRWLYRFGILPRAFREPYDAAPEKIDDYLDAIGEVRRTPAEWIAAAAANPAAPAEWLESLLAPSVVLEQGEQTASAKQFGDCESIRRTRLYEEIELIDGFELMTAVKIFAFLRGVAATTKSCVTEVKRDSIMWIDKKGGKQETLNSALEKWLQRHASRQVKRT
jgi:hypothetical protein